MPIVNHDYMENLDSLIFCDLRHKYLQLPLQVFHQDLKFRNFFLSLFIFTFKRTDMNGCQLKHSRMATEKLDFTDLNCSKLLCCNRALEYIDILTYLQLEGNKPPTFSNHQ